MSSAKSVAQPLPDTEKYIRMLSSDLARIFRRSTNPEFRQGLLDLVDATDSASFERLFDASLRSVYAPGNSQDANATDENVAASTSSVAPTVAINDGFVEVNDDADLVMPHFEGGQEDLVERVIAEVLENSSRFHRLDNVTPELAKHADELVAAILDDVVPAIASQPTSSSDHQLSLPALSIAQYSSDILTPRTAHRLFNFASDSENDEIEQANVVVSRHDSQLRRQQPAFSDYSENSQSTTSSSSSGFPAKTARMASFSLAENRQTSSHSFRQWHSFDEGEASGSERKSPFDSRPALRPSFSFTDSNNFASLNLELEFSPDPTKSFGNQMVFTKSVAQEYANANVSGSEHAASCAGWFSPSPLRSCFSFGTHGGSSGPSLLASSSVPSPTTWRPPLKVCKNERQPQAHQRAASDTRRKNNANMPAPTTFTKRKSQVDFSSSEDEN